MPFGLKIAPETFQISLDVILSYVRWQIGFIYLEDVIVLSRNFESHVQHLDEVLTLFNGAGMSLQLNKFEFFKQSLRYLGHIERPDKFAIVMDNKICYSRRHFPAYLYTAAQISEII